MSLHDDCPTVRLGRSAVTLRRLDPLTLRLSGGDPYQDHIITMDFVMALHILNTKNVSAVVIINEFSKETILRLTIKDVRATFAAQML